MSAELPGRQLHPDLWEILKTQGCLALYRRQPRNRGWRANYGATQQQTKVTADDGGARQKELLGGRDEEHFRSAEGPVGPDEGRQRGRGQTDSVKEDRW